MRTWPTAQRRHLPPTKAESKELEVISHAPFGIKPTIRLECVRVREDIWVARDGPGMAIRSIILRRNALTSDCQIRLSRLEYDNFPVYTVRSDFHRTTKGTHKNNHLCRAVWYTFMQVSYRHQLDGRDMITHRYQRPPSQGLRNEGTKARK